MTNNTNAIMQPDDWKINMSDSWQVLWWCRRLDLTKSQLETAILAVGTVIEDIERHLTRQEALKTDMPPAQSPGAAGHITSRNRLNRSPF